MSKGTIKDKEQDPNPFLTEKANLLWEQLDKGGAPVSKEELLARTKNIRDRLK